MGLSVARRLAVRLLPVVRSAADDRPGPRAVPVPRRRRATAGFTDNLTDEALTAGHVHTVTLGPGGTTKDIDLSTGQAVALRADLVTWVIHARETHRPKETRRTGRPPPGNGRRW